MAGCDHLFLLSPPSPRQTEQERHVIDAAKRAGSSTWSSSRCRGRTRTPVVFCRWHGQVEQHLERSGLSYTLLRPSNFMQNFLMSAQPVAEQGVFYGMLGEGRVGFIDTRDIAAVAAQLLTNPGHQGASYMLTGPEALSAAEVAERLSAAIGRQVRAVDVGPDAFRQGLAAAGLPGWLVDGVVEGNKLLAAGHGAEVTDEVARVLGRPPADVRAVRRRSPGGIRRPAALAAGRAAAAACRRRYPTPGLWAEMASSGGSPRVLDPADGSQRRGCRHGRPARFSRRRDDAARTVEAFAARLREQVDLDALSVELLSIVEQTMQPAQASLWLRPVAATRPSP